jgi:hypothetical protein
MSAHACQRFLHPFEFADGDAELATHGSVGTGTQHRHLGKTNTRRRQGNSTTDGQKLHQHAPATTNLLTTTDDPVERNEHIVARHRAILKHCIERPVTAP